MNSVKYVGMDVHKSITVIVVLNELGQFESQSQIKTKGENICDFFRGISGKVEVVFEEGTHSAWLYKRFWCNFSREGRLSLFQLLPTRQALLPIPAGSWLMGR